MCSLKPVITLYSELVESSVHLCRLFISFIVSSLRLREGVGSSGCLTKIFYTFLILVYSLEISEHCLNIPTRLV
jgi:hypothetical protein